MWSRGSAQNPYVGIIYAVYMWTTIDIINFQIEMDGAQGINNNAFDMYYVQGQQTRDSGILFCKRYQAGKFSVNYENPYGMRFNESIRIVAKNVSTAQNAQTGLVKEVIILYASVLD